VPDLKTCGIIDPSNQTKDYIMQGTIRFFLGFLITFGAVGTLDADPAASVLVQTGIALVGLAIMASGAMALKNKF